MWPQLGVVFLVAGLASFPADTSHTLQERYGQPISETYLVRPGIVISAHYGASGHACAVIVKPERPNHLPDSLKNTTGQDVQVVGILAELVPEKERGKYVMGTFLHLACSSSDTDIVCGGVEEDWEKVVILRSGNNKSQQYATIQWKRDECHDIHADAN